MIVLTEVDKEIAKCMEKRNYKIYKFDGKILVKDSDLDIYTENMLDEEFDNLVEREYGRR